MQQAAAGSAGGAGLDIDDVFSTFLYEGNGVARSITNGIDLSGEGGLVWIKNREDSQQHWLFDTERGSPYGLRSATDNAQLSRPYFGSFLSNGWSYAGTDLNSGAINKSGEDYVSWTFRKAPKFFDVVTYTGTSSAQAISHNLGSVPGMIIVKCTNDTGNWRVYHRGLDGGNAPEDYVINLNLTNAEANSSSFWNDTAPTSTHFTVGGDDDVNDFGDTYVAYLFAHNDGDGEFGPDGDQDIIKCGSYTGDGTTDGSNSINLGFEPQWIMIKKASEAANWNIYDNMRGVITNGSGNIDDHFLFPNLTNVEDTQARIAFNPTGFHLESSNGEVNQSSATYIYMAIRRGPLAAPDDATKVFGMQDYTGGGDGPVTGFVTDFALFKNTPESAVESFITQTRLTGQEYLLPSSTAAGGTLSNGAFDRMDGAGDTGLSGYNIWGWKRAPSYFDVVGYTGTNSVQTLNHNLGVAPEMIWIKERDGVSDWKVFHSSIGATKVLTLNTNAKSSTSSTWFNDTAPTATQFTIGTNSTINDSPLNYISYHFCTLDGISKVGGFSHTNGSTTDVSCGFSSGARFVLVKRTDADVFPAGWYVWDSTRGIVSGNSPYLLLNSTDSEVTNTDYINPLSSGFQMDSGFITGDYIFYAIA